MNEKHRRAKAAAAQREWDRATRMCERAWEIVEGDVNGERRRVRMGENDSGNSGRHDERRRGDM